MDWDSFEAGKLGLPMGSNTDVDSYLAGKKAREESEKNRVPGVAFTILIMATAIFLVYPPLAVKA